MGRPKWWRCRAVNCRRTACRGSEATAVHGQVRVGRAYLSCASSMRSLSVVAFTTVAGTTAMLTAADMTLSELCIDQKRLRRTSMLGVNCVEIKTSRCVGRRWRTWDRRRRRGSRWCRWAAGRSPPIATGSAHCARCTPRPSQVGRQSCTTAYRRRRRYRGDGMEWKHIVALALPAKLPAKRFAICIAPKLRRLDNDGLGRSKFNLRHRADDDATSLGWLHGGLIQV